MKTRESGMPPEEMWQGFFEPNSILEKLGLNAHCGNVLEFGCGYGTFTIPAAQTVRGKVFAIDIELEMLTITRSKADAAGLHNIELIQRDFAAEGTGLADGTVDYVMLFNILHAAERIAILSEAWRVLRPSGRLAIIHWNFDDATPRGPSMSIRPKPGECRIWAEEVGFLSISPSDIDLPPYHYGLVLERSRSKVE